MKVYIIITLVAVVFICSLKKEGLCDPTNCDGCKDYDPMGLSLRCNKSMCDTCPDMISPLINDINNLTLPISRSRFFINSIQSGSDSANAAVSAVEPTVSESSSNPSSVAPETDSTTDTTDTATDTDRATDTATDADNATDSASGANDSAASAFSIFSTINYPDPKLTIKYSLPVFSIYFYIFLIILFLAVLFLGQLIIK